MEFTTRQRIQNTLQFLENYCQDDYCIVQNKIIYNRNLLIPDIKGISTLNLSDVKVKGIVMVQTSEKLNFDYLPYAEGFSGLKCNHVTFREGHKISQKDILNRGLTPSFYSELRRQKMLNIARKIYRKIKFK